MTPRLTNNKEKVRIPPGTPAPAKVKILKCSYLRGWYANKIGEEFEVDNPAPPLDFLVWEDLVNGNFIIRHIQQQDCEKIQ